MKFMVIFLEGIALQNVAVTRQIRLLREVSVMLHTCQMCRVDSQDSSTFIQSWWQLTYMIQKLLKNSLTTNISSSYSTEEYSVQKLLWLFSFPIIISIITKILLIMFYLTENMSQFYIYASS